MFEWLKKLFAKPEPISTPEEKKDSPAFVAGGAKTKPCQSCGHPIIYDPTWKHIPNYCDECKAKYREEHPINRVKRTCRSCGKTFTVPATLEHKPNYCRECKKKWERR